MTLKPHTALGLALVLCVLFSGCRTERETRRATGPVNVIVRKVAPADTGREFAYSGTISESESAPQSFSVTGTVTRVHVNEGDIVVKGQLLAELDDTSYRDTYEMARAAEKQAEDAFNRLSRMFKNGNLPEVKYVEAETGLTRARSAAAIARKNLADCCLYASASGYVGKRSVDPGMVALPNLASITIVRIDRVFARVPVPENDIVLVRKGQRAAVTVGALGSREFEGKVEDIGVVADPLAHAYKIRIAVPNPDRAIKPGMVCAAVIKGLERSSGLVIPNEAVLVDEAGRNYVYCLDPSGARAFVRYVKLGELLQNGVRVAEGLREGEVLVVSGQHKLVNGSPVQVVER
jgi:membrane fusion protein (multidrug efflux system)